MNDILVAKMIQQNYEVVEGDGDSTRQWIINFILLLCGLFLVLSYEAVMTLVSTTVQHNLRGVLISMAYIGTNDVTHYSFATLI